jgi:hypothetical protein
MTDIALKAQEDLLCFDVSDEALEVAAGAGPKVVPLLERAGPVEVHRIDYFDRM